MRTWALGLSRPLDEVFAFSCENHHPRTTVGSGICVGVLVARLEEIILAQNGLSVFCVHSANINLLPLHARPCSERWVYSNE